MQERMLSNLPFFLKKMPDHYGLLSDADFYDLLTRMISIKSSQRPDLPEILESRFITAEKKL